MGTMVYSLLWVVQDFVHQPNYIVELRKSEHENRMIRAGAFYSLPYRNEGMDTPTS